MLQGVCAGGRRGDKRCGVDVMRRMRALPTRQCTGGSEDESGCSHPGCPAQPRRRRGRSAPAGHGGVEAATIPAEAARARCLPPGLGGWRRGHSRTPPAGSLAGRAGGSGAIAGGARGPRRDLPYFPQRRNRDHVCGRWDHAEGRSRRGCRKMAVGAMGAWDPGQGRLAFTAGKGRSGWAWAQVRASLCEGPLGTGRGLP